MKAGGGGPPGPPGRHRPKSWLLAFAVAWLVQGCAATGDVRTDGTAGAVQIQGFSIENELPYPVTDVMVEVPATGAFAGCGNILAGTACNSSFPEADYRDNPIVIRWSERGKPQATKPFRVSLPDSMAPGTSAWLQVVIFAPGQAGAKLLPAP